MILFSDPRSKCHKQSKEDTTLNSSYLTVIGPSANYVTPRNSHDEQPNTSYENIDMSLVNHTPPYTNVGSDIESTDERVNVTNTQTDYVDVSNPEFTSQSVTVVNGNEYTHLDGTRAPDNMYDRLLQNGTNI